VIQDVSTHLRPNIVRIVIYLETPLLFHAELSLLLAVFVTSARPAWLLLFCLQGADWW
jgi:hypothetical protein